LHPGHGVATPTKAHRGAARRPDEGPKETQLQILGGRPLDERLTPLIGNSALTGMGS